MFGTAGHYHELSYERLREDPAAACREVFEWIGLDASGSVTSMSNNLLGDAAHLNSTDLRIESTGSMAGLTGNTFSGGAVMVAERSTRNSLGFIAATTSRRTTAKTMTPTMIEAA